jgi:hypothetical protein
MLWHSIAVLALPALVQSHSHHAHNQEPFSQDRLDELEKKWGIDVSSPNMKRGIRTAVDGHSGAFLVFRRLLIFRIRAA